MDICLKDIKNWSKKKKNWSKNAERNLAQPQVGTCMLQGLNFLPLHVPTIDCKSSTNTDVGLTNKF